MIVHRKDISFEPISNNRWFIAGFTVLAMIILYIYLNNLQPIFQSKSIILVTQNTPTQTLDASVISVSSQLAETYVRIVKSRSILSSVSTKLNIEPINPSAIDARYIPRTQLIEIRVSDAAPENAAIINNALIEVLKNQVDELQQSINPSSRATIEIVENAISIDQPIFPNIPELMVIGFILFVILSILISYLAEILDSTIHSEEDIYKMFPTLSVIGTIPFDKDKPKKESTNESLRELVTNFTFLSPDNPPKTVAVISANPAEGKTFISKQLAIHLANSDKKVLLIDGDLRKGSLSKELGLQSETGIAKILIEGKSIDQINTTTLKPSGLKVLATGKGPNNPGELLASKRADAFFISLNKNKTFEEVIIDTPPVNAVADGMSIAARVDGVICVVQVNKTTRLQLKQAIESLQGVKANVLGIILNQDRSKVSKGYYYGKY